MFPKINNTIPKTTIPTTSSASNNHLTSEQALIIIHKNLVNIIDKSKSVPYVAICDLIDYKTAIEYVHNSQNKSSMFNSAPIETTLSQEVETILENHQDTLKALCTMLPSDFSANTKHSKDAESVLNFIDKEIESLQKPLIEQAKTLYCVNLAIDSKEAIAKACYKATSLRDDDINEKFNYIIQEVNKNTTQTDKNKKELLIEFFMQFFINNTNVSHLNDEMCAIPIHDIFIFVKCCLILSELSPANSETKTVLLTNLIENRRITQTDIMENRHMEENLVSLSILKELREFYRKFEEINLQLQRANLPGVNLQGANLERANLLEANLQWANLQRANLHGAYLQRAYLQWANLQRANLQWADLQGADLQGANLQWADLLETNLQGANLQGANLQDAKLRGANLQDTIFDNDTKIELRFENNLDREFNHITNNETGSILSTINSIDNKYRELKINLMTQVFEHLKNQDFSSIMAPLADVLFSDFDYSEALAKVPEFFEKFLGTIVNNGDLGPVKFEGNVIKIFLNYLSNPANEHILTNIFTIHNAFFIQLIYQANKIEEYRTASAKLYKFYLDNNKVAQDAYEQLSRGPFGVEQEKVDLFVFVSGYKALVLSPEYLSELFYRDDKDIEMLIIQPCDWRDIAYFEKLAPVDMKSSNAPSLSEIFINPSFRVFKGPYEFEQRHAKFNKFLEVLNLGKYSFVFLRANIDGGSTTKFLEDELDDVFIPHFDNYNNTPDTSNLRLTTAHVNKILERFEFSKESPQDQARLLLIWSAIFANYSSSKFFGTEGNSPLILRHYAYALMRAAIDKDSSIIPEHILNDWTEKFLGLNGAFTCSSVLSDMMTRFCKQFPNHLEKFSGFITSKYF